MLYARAQYATLYACWFVMIIASVKVQLPSPFHNMQVAPRNTVSLTQQDHTLQGGIYRVPLEPHVSHVAFSNDGSVMATVDVRPNAGSLGSDEQSLRFWDRTQGGVTMGSDQEQPIYSINAYIDDPHRYLIKAPALVPHHMWQQLSGWPLLMLVINHDLRYFHQDAPVAFGNQHEPSLQRLS